MDDDDTGIDADGPARTETAAGEAGRGEGSRIDGETGPPDERTTVASDGNNDAAATEPASHARATNPVEGSQEAPIGTDGEETTDKENERAWIMPLAVGVFVVVLIAAVAILLLLNRGADSGRDGRDTGRGTIDQANWKITSFSIGGKAGGGKNPSPPRQHQQDLEKLVRRWHDALYLFPSELRGATQRYFTSGATRAFRSSNLGLPNHAREIQTTRRTARIGIEAAPAERAAAIVNVVATGETSGRAFRSTSESRLWLERQGSKWKVVAFDVDQRPLPTNPSKGNNKKPRKDEKPGDKNNPASKNAGGKGDAS